MDKLTSKQKKRLKDLAHNLKPAVYVGKKGITTELIQTIAKVIEDHELIKIKLLQFKEDKNDIVSVLTSEIKAHLVEVIGNIVILYKASEKQKKIILNHDE